VIRSARRGELDRKGGDHRESVPFACRLEDATSGNTQQLAATRGNSQRPEVKAFKHRLSNKQQLPATRSNSTGTPLLTGGLLVRIQPEEPTHYPATTSTDELCAITIRFEPDDFEIVSVSVSKRCRFP
jgi:hypothetical protein